VSRFAPVVLFFTLGCGGKQEPVAADTGAREAAGAFFGAVIAGDSPHAYELLDSDSKRRVSSEQFATLVRAYVKNLGFPADKVHIHTSEEQGDSATVRVTLYRHSAGHSRRYSDGITLRRTGDRWSVVLPTNFGHKTR
jgi:hypothetical protein